MNDPYDVAELQEALVKRDNEIASLRRRLEESEKYAESCRITVERYRTSSWPSQLLKTPSNEDLV